MTGKLDTSGKVPHRDDRLEPYCWNDLSPFQQGYVEGFAAWCRENCIAASLRNFRFDRLSPEALVAIRNRCDFRLKATKLPVGYTAEDGRLFWEEQQRGELSYFPPYRVFLSEDGKVSLAQKP